MKLIERYLQSFFTGWYADENKKVSRDWVKVFLLWQPKTLVQKLDEQVQLYFKKQIEVEHLTPLVLKMYKNFNNTRDKSTIIN